MNEPRSGLPLPDDSIDKGAAAGGGGDIVVYEVPRFREVVAAEMKTLASADGWKLEKDEKSPRGSIRLAFSKAAMLVKVSFAGDDTRSSIIITLP